MTVKTVFTPLGSLVLNEHDNHLVDLSWNYEHHLNSSPVLDQAAEEIQAYLNKDLRDFTVSTKFNRGTEFQRKVWQAIAEIPYGETVTYNDIAREIKSSPRAVGTACGKNPLPLIIPCHRVVGASGKLTGYSGGDGTLTKQILLDFEQTPKNEVTNLALWQGLRAQIPQKPFYFMRHGQTDYNLNRILQGGLINSDLNATGRQQAQNAGKALAKVFNPNVVWRSNMKRTEQTAEGVLSQLPNKERILAVHDGLNEKSFGDWDGKSEQELPPFQHLYQCSPEGESWLKVVNRMAGALTDILNSTDEVPLIVAHGAVARTVGDLLGCWPALGDRFLNCEIWYVEPPKSGTVDQPWSGTQIHAGE